MCYGIRTDFQGKLFDGSSELLAIADNLIELKTICSECDKKATMVVRLDSNGKVLYISLPPTRTFLHQGVSPHVNLNM